MIRGKREMSVEGSTGFIVPLYTKDRRPCSEADHAVHNDPDWAPLVLLSPEGAA